MDSANYLPHSFPACLMLGLKRFDIPLLDSAKLVLNPIKSSRMSLTCDRELFFGWLDGFGRVQRN